LLAEYGSEMSLSLVVANQYPDYYVRGARAEILLRIDCKLLHDESDEYSARFRLLADDIRASDDLLLYGAWQWRTLSQGQKLVVYPHVLETLVIPAMEIATERDLRLKLTGGRFDNGRPVVPPNFNEDTNFGKINRIVHSERRDAHGLTSNVRALLAFTQRHADAVRRASEEATEVLPTDDEVTPQESEGNNSFST
jgi:hypothetical protein